MIGNRFVVVVGALAFLVAGGACSKKKTKTTPKGGPVKIKKGPRFEMKVVYKKGAKLLVCEVPSGGKMVTYDINRDKHENIDIWKVFRKDGSVACREQDMNFDGKRDLVIKYYNNGARREIWLDEDWDGKFDLIMHLRPDGTLARVEMDTNSDGKIDTWKRYRLNKDNKNVAYTVVRDRDYDGYRDYWERYDENGNIDEISWTDEGDQNEKPKYWLSNPTQDEETAAEATSEPRKPAKGDKARPAARGASK